MPDTPTIDGVSLETRAQIDADEQRALLKKALWQLLIVAFTVGLWLLSGSKTGDPHFYFVGISALPSLSTLWQWWRRSRLDGAEAADFTAAEKRRVAEKEVVKAALAAHRPYLTLGIGAILVIIALLQVALTHSVPLSIQAAGLVKSAVRSGQWWRLITGTYLHGGPMHVYGNVFALVVLGHMMETFLPRWHLPVVYVVAGIMGSAASVLLLPATSIGASGAILGLSGYLLTVGMLEPARLPRTVFLQVLTMIGLTAYSGAFGYGFIDNAAHLGGALGGAIMAWLLTPRGEDHSGIAPPQWNLVGALACAFILISAIGTTVVLARVRASSDVVSVAISLVDGTRPAALIENLGGRTLEAYRFHVNLDGQAIATGWRDDCCFGSVNRAQPLAPHASIQVPLTVTGGVSFGRPQAQITLAVFDDGSFEGSRDEFEALGRQRKFVADDAAYWRAAIDQQRDAPLLSRFGAFKKAYETQVQSTPLGRPSAEALGIPQLIFAAGSNAEAYASVATSTRINLDAIERALRARLAASAAPR